jgi:hypothetical protein
MRMRRVVSVLILLLAVCPLAAAATTGIFLPVDDSLKPQIRSGSSDVSTVMAARKDVRSINHGVVVYAGPHGESSGYVVIVKHKAPLGHSFILPAYDYAVSGTSCGRVEDSIDSKNFPFIYVERNSWFSGAVAASWSTHLLTARDESVCSSGGSGGCSFEPLQPVTRGDLIMAVILGVAKREGVISAAGVVPGGAGSAPEWLYLFLVKA